MVCTYTTEMKQSYLFMAWKEALKCKPPGNLNDLKKNQFHSLKPRGLHLLLCVPCKTHIDIKSIVPHCTIMRYQ